MGEPCLLNFSGESLIPIRYICIKIINSNSLHIDSRGKALRAASNHKRRAKLHTFLGHRALAQRVLSPTIGLRQDIPYRNPARRTRHPPGQSTSPARRKLQTRQAKRKASQANNAPARQNLYKGSDGSMNIYVTITLFINRYIIMNPYVSSLIVPCEGCLKLTIDTMLWASILVLDFPMESEGQG